MRDKLWLSSTELCAAGPKSFSVICFCLYLDTRWHCWVVLPDLERQHLLTLLHGMPVTTSLRWMPG